MEESTLEVGIEDLGETTNSLETIAQLEELLRQLKHENKTLKERNKHLNECLEESESKLDKATKASEAEQELRRESDRFRLDNRKKEEDLQRLSEDLQKLQRSYDELEKKNRANERMREMETASSRSEYGSVGGHEPCCLRVGELEEQLDSANEQGTKYRTEAEEYKVQFEETSKLLNESRQRVKVLEQEKEELETRSHTIDEKKSLFNEMADVGSNHASPTRSQIQTPPTSPSGMQSLEFDESVQQISLSAEPEDAGEPDVSEEIVQVPFVSSSESRLLSRATFNHRSKSRVQFVLVVVLLFFVLYCFYLHPLQMIIDATNMNELYDRTQYI